MNFVAVAVCVPVLHLAPAAVRVNFQLPTTPAYTQVLRAGHEMPAGRTCSGKDYESIPG